MIGTAGAQGWSGEWIAEARANAKNLGAFSLAILLAAAWGAPPNVNAKSSGTSEYEVKAAFLFHFAQFVEWPTAAFHDVDSALTYCTVGEDVFRGALDESVKGKRVGDRTLRVLHLKERDAIDGCQILFVSAAQKGRQMEELASATGRPVLTVGEAEHFVQEGGMIGFCLEEKKVRFEINQGAAEKAQLKISARLLALAKTVLGNSRGD